MFSVSMKKTKNQTNWKRAWKVDAMKNLQKINFNKARLWDTNPLIRTNSHLKHDSTVKSKHENSNLKPPYPVFLNNGSCYLRSHWCKINSKKESENWIHLIKFYLCWPIVSNESQMGLDNIIERQVFFVKWWAAVIGNLITQRWVET